MSEICIDWCSRARIGDLQAFINDHWLQGHVLSRDTKLLEWQHPFTRDPTRLSVLVAEDNHKIVGTLGVIPFEFYFQGSCHPSAWLTMWLAAPAWRKARVGLRLLEHVLRNYEAVGTIGANELSLRIYQGLGFLTMAALPRWTRILDGKALKRLTGKPVGVPDQTTLPGTSIYRVVSWSEEIAGHWDAAWQQRFAPGLATVWRDAAYLRWRYVNHPRLHYEIRFALHGSTFDVSGIAIYRLEAVRDSESTVLRVLEFLAEDGADIALARVIIDAGKQAGAAFADFYCASPRLGVALEATGFIRSEHTEGEFPSLFQPLEPKPRPLALALRLRNQVGSLSNLYLTRADCDQDRPN